MEKDLIYGFAIPKPHNFVKETELVYYLHRVTVYITFLREYKVAEIVQAISPRVVLPAEFTNTFLLFYFPFEDAVRDAGYRTIRMPVSIVNRLIPPDITITTLGYENRVISERYYPKKLQIIASGPRTTPYKRIIRLNGKKA